MKSKSKIIICMGTGGVGKTTISASIAFSKASEGNKVLVITMDPSHRLATSLGVTKDGESHKINLNNANGEIWASVINHKKTFDAFLTKAAKKNVDISKILTNPLYQKLSTTLSGSQEFTAIERLLSEVESQNYDYIVLDTPPSQNAFDFLKAPQKLSMLFNDKIAQWFRGIDGDQGFLKRIMHQGTLQVLKVLEIITGAKFISQLKDFFIQINSWQDKLNQRTSSLEMILKGSQTQFVIVGHSDEYKIRDSISLIRQLENEGYPVSHIVINKMYPHWLENGQKFQNELNSKMYLDFYNHFENQRNKVIEKIKLENLKLDKLFLPEYENEVFQLDDLILFSNELKGRI